MISPQTRLQTDSHKAAPRAAGSRRANPRRPLPAARDSRRLGAVGKSARQLGCLAMGLLALAVALPAPARAEALTYTGTPRIIKAGILIPLSMYRSNPVAPYLFQILDDRTDLKPIGWDIQNPLAPSRVDQNILARWNRQDYTDGQALTKDMAAYWEIPLNNVSASDLEDFDVLFLAGDRGTARTFLTPDEREKIRKALDAGVTVWVENEGGWNLDASNLPWNGTFGRSSGAAVNGTVRVLQPFTGALNNPYTLNPGELNTLTAAGIGASVTQVINTSQSFEVAPFTPLLATGTGTQFFAVGPYGSGHLVLSGAPVAAVINAGALRGAQANPWTASNLGAYGGTDVSNVPPTQLKLAYNLMSLSLSSPQERKDSRHNNSTGDTVGAPLTRKWTFPNGPSDLTVTTGHWRPNYPNSSAPAVFKGCAFVAAADGVLYAFDMEPGRDLDGNGNPDDGTLPPGQERPNDFSTGAPYDILWSYDLGSKIGSAKTGSTGRLISSPTLATINDPLLGPVDVLFVTTEDGKVWAFRAFPASNGQLSGLPQLYWPQPVQYSGAFPRISNLPLRIPAPVFYSGRLFVAGVDPDQPTQGVVAELDPATGRTLWEYRRTTRTVAAQAFPLGRVMASPSVGWVTDTNTGASDLVMYVPTMSDPTNGQTARMFSFLLSVRNERLTDSGDHIRFRSRNWLPPQNFVWSHYRIWVKGNRSITGTVDPNAPGQVQLSEPIDPATMTVYADYDLDEAAANYKPRSTFFAFQGLGTEFPDFISTPVIGPDDTVYAVAVDLAGRRTSLYAYKEQAPIALLKWRYSFTNTVVLGSPAYYKGTLYLGTADGHLIGFDTRASFYLDLSGIIDLSRKYQIQILQRDPMLPANYALNTYTFNTAQFDADNVTDTDASGVAREHGRIFIKAFSLSGSAGLDASQSIIVRYPVVGGTGQSEETVQVIASTVGGVLPAGGAGTGVASGLGSQANKIFDATIGTALGGGVDLVAGPTIAGSYMYIPDGKGNILSYPSDPRLLASTGGQLVLPATSPEPPQIGVPAAGNANAPITAPVVAVDGSLIANTPGGVMVFQQPITLVADANRILEIQNAYNLNLEGGQAGSAILWGLTSTVRKWAWPKPGQSNPVDGIIVPTPIARLDTPEIISFSHPAVALRRSSTDFLVADTGNNRIVEVDRAGNVTWELSSFADPEGILGGSEPLTLSTPTDVQRWVTPHLNAAGQSIGVEWHTLVVDSGHNRILEIRDVFPNDPKDMSGEYHVLAWASQTTSANHQYAYRNAQRLADGTTVATILNYSINSIDGSVPDSQGGSLVLLSGPRRNPTTGAIIPDPKNANRPLDPGGVPIAFANKVTSVDSSGSVSTKALINPVYFQRFFTGTGVNRPHALLVDGHGVYEVEISPPALAATGNVAAGEMTLKVVGAITIPQAVGAVCAKRLANGNTLITNQSQGLVFEYEGLTNTPFLVSPVTQGTSALLQPAYADRTF